MRLPLKAQWQGFPTLCYPRGMTDESLPPLSAPGEVDDSLILWMLSLSALERIEMNDRYQRDIQVLREAYERYQSAHHSPSPVEA